MSGVYKLCGNFRRNEVVLLLIRTYAYELSVFWTACRTPRVTELNNSILTIINTNKFSTHSLRSPAAAGAVGPKCVAVMLTRKFDIVDMASKGKI